MAEIERPGRIQGMQWRQGGRQGGHQGSGHGRSHAGWHRKQLAAYGREDGPHVIADAVDIAGIDLEQLHPDLRVPIERMSLEIATLRQEVEREQHILQFLETQADEDPWTGLANTRIVSRSVEHILSLPEDERPGAVFALFWLENHDAIHKAYGMEGLFVSLKATAQKVREGLSGNASVAVVGSAGLGALIFPTDATWASEAAQSITRQIEDTPAVYENTSIQLRVAFGLHVVVHNDTLETIIHSADSSLHADRRTSHVGREERVIFKCRIPSLGDNVGN